MYFEPPAGIKGSRVLNVISYNEHGDMLLTYAFANGKSNSSNQYQNARWRKNHHMVAYRYDQIG